MTGGVVFIYVLPLMVVVLIAATSGGLTAWWLLHHRQTAAELVTSKPEPDQFMDAEIDIAAVKWAEDNHLPTEAAGLMSARLKTLHMIGKGKEWFE